MLADIITPVSCYLRIRDKYPNSILLESADYHGNYNSFSYLAFDAVARFAYENGAVSTVFPGKEELRTTVSAKELMPALRLFKDQFGAQPSGFPFITNGLFGFFGFPAVEGFEDIQLAAYVPDENRIPAAVFQVYRYVVAINHFKDELHLFEHQYLQENEPMQGKFYPT